ncbi:MAG TPA: glycosyltransferase family 39 protein [Acidimicrobiia bacterium]
MQRRVRAIPSGLGAGLVAAMVCSVFAWLGVVNGDEGWYAICARIVSEGRLPYRDFAFTQGPVYLYLLAPFVRLVPDLYTARAVSVVCTAVAVGLLVTMANRVGGKWAARASCLALLATIPSLPYWLSITKTYALSCLLLSAILFTLTSATRPAVRYPVVAALAVVLTETRSTGFPLALLLIVALMVLSPEPKIRVRVVMASVAATVPFAVLVSLEWTRAKWGLLDYHHLSSKGTPGPGRFVSRTFAVAHAWPGPFVLATAALVVVLFDAGIRARLRRRLDLVAVAVGIVLFVVLHEAAAQFFSEEYLAPVIAPLVVVSVVILVRAATAQGAAALSRRLNLAVRGVLVGAIAFTAFTGGHSYYLGAPGWSGDPAGLSAITKCVQRYSKPHDTVFALSLEEVVVEAHRQPVPGVTLGVFSYQDFSIDKARQMKVLDAATLASTFQHRPPKVAVLTVDDIFETHRAGYFSHQKVVNNAWYFRFQAYKPVCHVTIIRHVFKNEPVVVTVYARGGARH